METIDEWMMNQIDHNNQEETIRNQLLTLLDNLAKEILKANNKDIIETLKLTHSIRGDIESGRYDTQKKWSRVPWRK